MTKWQDVMVAMNGTTKLVILFHLLFSRRRKRGDSDFESGITWSLFSVYQSEFW